jgi:hypothetical protein
MDDQGSKADEEGKAKKLFPSFRQLDKRGEVDMYARGWEEGRLDGIRDCLSWLVKEKPNLVTAWRGCAEYLTLEMKKYFFPKPKE